LRKSPTRTPAFLQANRRNAQKSTGPCTRRGKAQSCLNRLKTGERSRVYRRLWLGLLDAPPCAVEPTARALLTREQAAHPVFAELVGLSGWAESMVAMDERWDRELWAAKQKAWATSENEPQEPAWAYESGEKFLMEQKHLIRQPTDKGAEAQRKQSTFTFERGRGQNKKMLNIDVGSRKVIENKRNDDIVSCDSADILGNSVPVLPENAHLGWTRITFSMRFGRQCTALAMPRCESQNLPDARGKNYRRHALSVVHHIRLVSAGLGGAAENPSACRAGNTTHDKRKTSPTRQARMGQFFPLGKFPASVAADLGTP
jgi:hypothetical protein